MKTPILGSSYVARSVNAADSRMVNLYPEMIPEGGKEPAFLQRTPGLSLAYSVGTGPIRGMMNVNDTLYIVSGEDLYSIGFGTTNIGKVSGATEPVSMATNGTQIFIACNGPSYVYNINTAAFGAITDPDFPGALTVSYLDGYFVFIEPDSQKVWVTALNDPTSIDPLDFASAEGDPDGLVSSIVDHSEVWLFGTNSVEVWYNSGSADFPLQRIQGAFNELGCAATFSVAKMDNSIFWLGRDARGYGIVYRANGYTGQRVSTHAVEWQIQQYTNIQDAIAYTYQQDGHTFYVLNFPSAKATWVYDAATQSWHERAGWVNGQFTRHRANCQVALYGQVLVGDHQNGSIYYVRPDVYTDYDRPQKWLRSWRALATGQNNLTRTAHHSLQLDCETGTGIVGGMKYSAQKTEVVGTAGSAVSSTLGVAVDLPTGTRQGDLVLVIAFAESAAPAMLSSGFSSIGAPSATAKFRGRIWSKVAEISDASVSVGAANGAFVVVVVRNLDSSLVSVFSSSYTASQQPDSPALTSYPNGLFLSIAGMNSSLLSESVNAPIGYSRIESVVGSGDAANDGATIVVAAKSDLSTLEDPGAFSGSTAIRSIATSISIGPTGAVIENDPSVMLRWSDDGGHTWSSEHWQTMGKEGQYQKRVIWRRLGMTQKLRDRVYEVSGTDPAKIAILGAELLVSGTNA